MQKYYINKTTKVLQHSSATAILQYFSITERWYYKAKILLRYSTKIRQYDSTTVLWIGFPPKEVSQDCPLDQLPAQGMLPNWLFEWSQLDEAELRYFGAPAASVQKLGSAELCAATRNLHVYVHVSVYVHVYVYVHVCMCIHTSTHIHR